MSPWQCFTLLSPIYGDFPPHENVVLSTEITCKFARVTASYTIVLEYLRPSPHLANM